MSGSLGFGRDNLRSYVPGSIWTFRQIDMYETLHRQLTLCGASMNWLWFPLRGNFILHRAKRFSACQRKERQFSLTRQPDPWTWWLLFLVVHLCGSDVNSEYQQGMMWKMEVELRASCSVLALSPGVLIMRYQWLESKYLPKYDALKNVWDEWKADVLLLFLWL